MRRLRRPGGATSTSSVATARPLAALLPTFLLVRHGTTAATGTRLGGWTDAPLDERGRDQVGATAARLAEIPVAAVHTSPIVRTRQTAELLATPHGLQPQVAEGLAEVEYGEWTDAELKPLRDHELWPVIQTTPSRVRFPGGGTIRGVQARAVDQLEVLAAAHAEHDVVIAVSHADVIKAVVAWFVGMPLDAFQRLVVAPASVTVLALASGRAPALLRFNDTGPLEIPTRPDPGEPDPGEPDPGEPDPGEADGGQTTDAAAGQEEVS